MASATTALPVCAVHYACDKPPYRPAQYRTRRLPPEGALPFPTDARHRMQRFVRQLTRFTSCCQRALLELLRSLDVLQFVPVVLHRKIPPNPALIAFLHDAAACVPLPDGIRPFPRFPLCGSPPHSAATPRFADRPAVRVPPATAHCCFRFRSGSIRGSFHRCGALNHATGEDRRTAERYAQQPCFQVLGVAEIGVVPQQPEKTS